MIELTTAEVDSVLSRLPVQVVRMLRMSGLYLAGGFIRAIAAGEKPSDIDIFSPSREVAKRYSKILATSLGTRVAFVTPNAISISRKGEAIQFITRWLFETPEKVIESFDFTIAQALIYFDKEKGEWRGIVSDQFCEDVRKKRLVYTSPTREEDAAGSLLRVNKFAARGYKISDEDLAKVVARVGLAANKEAMMIPITAPEEIGDEVAPYRRVIRAARPKGGASV